MADLHTDVAYPFTKSNRPKDKIMSEVMLSRLHLALVGNNDKVIISGTTESPDEVLLGGYYFKINHTAMPDPSYLIIFVEKGDSDIQFPELIESKGSANIAPHECLFDKNIYLNGVIGNDLTDEFQESTGISKIAGGEGYEKDGKAIDAFGGSTSEFVNLSSLFSVYYFGETEDNTKKGKIWVKTDANGNILNPYVYDNVSSGWVPLGAVYKN